MKNKKKTFLVLGYLDTGSGTLTFPEDFDFIGSYTDQEEAQKHVDLLNKREGHGDDGDDELVEDFEGEGMVYTVWPVDSLSKCPKDV